MKRPLVLRSVDLAREVGLSTQQIRNYADAGVLPSTERTESGYRVYTEAHRNALLTYRALAPGFGPDPARAIMVAANTGDTAEALRLLDAGHADVHGQRRELAAIGAALATVAGQTPETPSHGELLVGELAAKLGVRPSALRVWESAGLLAPNRERGTGYRRYAPADVRDARMISMLRRGHQPLPRIRPILEELRRTGSSEALREAIEDRQRALVQRSERLLTGACFLRHYLDGRDPPE